MKILFYISTIKGGGAARVMVNLANNLAKENNEIIFVTNFPYQNEYKLESVIKRICLEKTENKENKLLKNYNRIKNLRYSIKKYSPDICVAFMIENNVRLLLSTIFSKTKTIISVRNDPKKEYKGFLGYLIGKFLFRLADGIVFQTKQAQSWFPKSIQKKSKVIFNPVAESFYQVKRAEKSHHIVTCGRLSPQKNHFLLIRAFSKIADKYPQENLLIYGEGKLENSLKQLIDQLHLQNRIFLMGLSSNVEEILSKAKLFVLSSDYEGMPNALMEALAVGVPSISTDCPCGGPNELIQHEKNGLLISCNDEISLIQAIDKLLSNPIKAEDMGNYARSTSQKFKQEVITRLWGKFLLKEIIC